MRKVAIAALALGITLLSSPITLADLLHLKDGTKVAGRIVREMDEAVVIETRDGTRTIQRDAIEKVQARSELWKVYREKLGRIRLADAGAHFALAEWLEGVGLFEEAGNRLRAVLSLDPDHEGARARLGYVRKKGRWVIPGRDATTREGRRREASDHRIPADVAALAALTQSESAWERTVAYRRLAGTTDFRRDWLIRSLEDPTSPGHEDAAAEIGAAPDEILQAIGAGTVAEIVDAHIDAAIRAPLADHFTRQRKEIRSRLTSDYRKARALVPEIRAGRGANERQRMLDEVQKAQKAALDVIYDTENYYKTADGVVFGQNLVDEKVQGLREIWHGFDRQVKADLSRLLSVSRESIGKLMTKLIGREEMLSETESFLSSAGVSFDDSGKTIGAVARCLLTYRAGRFRLAEGMADGLTPWETVLLTRMRDLTVLEANEALAASEPASGLAPKANELKQSKILNDYRMVLGRHALEVNPNLTECARGHSEEMTRLGYFGHESPVPERKTPSMRAKLAGYPDSVSENIHMSGGMATPEEAHLGWYRSPPHHRNMVSDAWFCMGAGQHGSHFTQNFGTLTSVPR